MMAQRSTSGAEMVEIGARIRCGKLLMGAHYEWPLTKDVVAGAAGQRTCGEGQ
jgi:hypothetical protein